ncbi:response regulator [Streptantibioticus cattleyicolor]|uniref:Two-component regulator n=1 Tax=Streptantibioticus cattleyicolor (strain ATCC 35852 / DSM 46488 / JCM 4925 / NBRC 14057 / NRRL 8057) TaxID=1003195 RepID=F8JMR9_STREN|nr:response regulator [Streptantibioticus cattleyicolor]AEW99295.1 two-component regulator [Streptantibioticus cattleyicolor NRRL 8057 = DSM 46488]CCB71665.1 Two-component regulator (modular protein) [Streptantibioticus cattleyicolor NRRL 8057 = DSM 46488]
MAELRPLGQDLTQESRALAQALRELFDGLDVSVRRYAARRVRDAGTFSRYLNGTRVPPWEVVMDLFTDLAEHRGTAATPEAIDLLRGLHRAAVATNASPKHAMEVLEQQLADADRLSRRSTARGDALGDALLDRKHRIADLEVRLNQLEAEWAAERERADRLAAARPDVSGLLRERDTLQAEVARLAAELLAARDQRDAAEERCQLLERQLETVERAQHTAALPTPRAPGPAQRMPKVLVVDDQPDNLLAMTAVLSTLDQELVAVPSGRDALKALLDHDDFAVIIMDVQMPDMDGYETAAHIKRRSRDRDVPIIFLTAMGADPEHSARGYAAGAVDYIGKPFDPWVLRAKVAVFTGIYLERRLRHPDPA